MEEFKISLFPFWLFKGDSYLLTCTNNCINLLYRYVAEVCAHIYRNRSKVCGYTIAWEPPWLRHFTAHLEPIPPPSEASEETDKVRRPSAVKVSSGQVLRRRKNSSMQFS